MAIRRRKPVKRSAPTSAPPSVDPQEAALVAYELFRRRGGAHGHDQEDWIEAERILRSRRRRMRA